MDHTDTALRAVTKALTDVIAPAIDPKDVLALEQLRLAVHQVEFVRSRLDHFHGRERLELTNVTAMASQLADIVKDDEGLARAAELGRSALDDPATSTSTLKATIAEIAARISETVRAAAEMPADLRKRIHRCVLEASEPQIAFERAWYVPMGFDPAPWQLQPVEELLDAVV